MLAKNIVFLKTTHISLFLGSGVKMVIQIKEFLRFNNTSYYF